MEGPSVAFFKRSFQLLVLYTGEKRNGVNQEGRASASEIQNDEQDFTTLAH